MKNRNKAQAAAWEFLEMDDLAACHSPMHSLSSLSKLWVSVLYIFTVASFHKYDLSGLTMMLLFPLIGYQMAYLPVGICFRKLRVVLPLVCAVGLANPFFDRTILITVGRFGISGGWISMITLMMKGILCLMAAFLLTATTGMEGVCRALRRIHVPSMMTTLLLLTYRYISVLLNEVSVMTEAYHLRAPGQKGIHFSAWGSFLGQVILRSMDRAQGIYESMLLRGYNGEFIYNETTEYNRAASWIFAVLCSVCFVICRWYNIPVLLGRLLLP